MQLWKEKIGKILLELKGFKIKRAITLLSTALIKLPIKTKIIKND